jgi:hypothetical protein
LVTPLDGSTVNPNPSKEMKKQRRLKKWEMGESGAGVTVWNQNCNNNLKRDLSIFFQLLFGLSLSEKLGLEPK